jgi:hypothetical protein
VSRVAVHRAHPAAKVPGYHSRTVDPQRLIECYIVVVNNILKYQSLRRYRSGSKGHRYERTERELKARGKRGERAMGSVRGLGNHGFGSLSA